ncbi:MAG: MFS transporter [Actinobacteria bacterium]|nr:MFS transporter [Actinomycetota bacterium]
MQQQDWRPTRLSTASWAVYDLANTIFALGVGSLYFAEWLTDHRSGIPSLLLRNDTPDLALAVTIDIAMIIIIVLAPWIGARSDHFGRRRRYLIPMTLLCVVPTFFLAAGSVTASLLLFAVALVGFNLGGIVYDAMLPDVSTPQNIGLVSGVGIGVGYLGSFVAVAIGLLLLDDHGYPTVFKAIAVLFALFAIPAFTLVEERPRPALVGPPPALADSFRRLRKAWKDASAYPGVIRFLVGRFFYTDAVNTLIAGFLTIYVKEELGFSSDEVQLLLGCSIVGAMVGGFGGGFLVDRLGPRRLLHLVLYLWLVAFAVGIVAGAVDIGLLGWPLGALGGLALGGLWAADRVYMARISPPARLGEFYGLYATVGRFAAILGPLLFGLIVSILGLPREVALGALMVFIVAARVILQGVDDSPRAWSGADLAG